MLPLGVLTHIIPRHLVSNDLEQVDLLAVEGVQELARRAIPGAIIVPCCLLLSLFSSTFYLEYSNISILFVLLMVSGACLRAGGIFTLLFRPAFPFVSALRIFVTGCLLMALSWGGWTAVIVSHYGEGFPALLVFVLSSGIGAGIVANFSIWRNLALVVLLFAFIPAVLCTALVVHGGHWLLIVAMVFFLAYVFFQINRWYQAYWDALVTARRCEQQAATMVNLNRQLANLVEREQDARQEVEAGRRKMHELFDHSRDGIMICEFSGQIVEINQTFIKLIGRSRQELLGLKAEALFHFDGNGGARPPWSHAEKGWEECCEGKLCRANKSLLPVNINMRSVEWQSEDVIILSVSDISKQKEAQDLLALTQKAFSSGEGYRQKVLPNIEVPMFCKDINGRYLTVNSAFQQLCACPHELYRGRKDEEIFPEEMNRFFRAGDEKIMATGVAMEFEKTLDMAGSLKELWLHKFALYDDNGSIIGVGGICTDRVTVKKALQIARKTNEAEAEFFANMSHELRTPLLSLISFARLGRRKVAEGTREKLQSYFAMIVNNGERFLDLLNNFLTLTTLEARRDCYHPEQGSLSGDLELVVEEFKAAAEERNLVVRLDLPAEHVNAVYDRTKLYQVIRNLLVNAIKFSAENSEIKVELQKDILATGATVHPAWKIMVIDQGVGLEQDELDLVFGKFIQGRRNGGAGAGVGLGLALCKRIVEDHGGIIWAERNESGGSTFAFLLPQPENL